MSTERREIEFNEGCMGDGDPWWIVLDVHRESSGHSCEIKPCKHAKIIDSSHPRWKVDISKAHATLGKDFTCSLQWIMAREVQASNEGGCNGTSICLDCILEAAETLKRGHTTSVDDKESETLEKDYTAKDKEIDIPVWCKWVR